MKKNSLLFILVIMSIVPIFIIFFIQMINIKIEMHNYHSLKMSRLAYKNFNIIKDIYLLMNTEKNTVIMSGVTNYDSLYIKTDLSLASLKRSFFFNENMNDYEHFFYDFERRLYYVRSQSLYKSKNDIFIDYIVLMEDVFNLFKNQIRVRTTQGTGAKVFSTYLLNITCYQMNVLVDYLNLQSSEFSPDTMQKIFLKTLSNLQVLMYSPDFSYTEYSKTMLNHIPEHPVYKLLIGLQKDNSDVLCTELLMNRNEIYQFLTELQNLINYEINQNEIYFYTRADSQFYKVILLFILLFFTCIAIYIFILYIKRSVISPINIIIDSIENQVVDIELLKKISTSEFRKLAQILIDYYVQNREFLINKEKLNAIAKFSYSWEYWLNDSGDYLYASPSSEFIIGYSAEEFYCDNQLMDLLIFEDDIHLYKTTIKKVKNSEDNHYSIDIRIRHKDGRLLFFNNKCRRIYDDNGNFKGYRGVFIDITQYKELMNKLNSSEKMYKTLIDSIPDAICIVNSESKIKYASVSFLKLFGYEDMSQVINQDILLFFSETYKPVYSSFIDQITDSYSNININDKRFLMYKRDLTEFFAKICLSSVFDESGRFRNIFLIIRDDTYTHNLISNLESSKNEANKANIVKTKFLSNISHEIRTPLNGIIGVLELLKLSNLSIPQKEYIELIDLSASKLYGLLNNILDVSSIENNVIKLNKKKFKFSSLMKKIISIVKINIKSKHINFIYEIDDNIPDILIGDSNRIFQIFNNVLSNSIKYTETGEIRFSVNLHRVDDNNFFIDCNISDTGVGIATENLLGMFDSFTQNEPDNDKKYGGAGLGLYLTKKIVDLMNGDISVKSELYKGTEVKIKLPFENVIDVKEDSQSKPVFNVLFINNYVSNLHPLLYYLERNEINIDFAESIKASLEKLQSKNYDLLFIDIDASDCFGLSFVNYLLKMNLIIKSKTVLLTSYVATENQIVNLTNDYLVLSQPYNLDYLEKVISKFFENKHLPLKIKQKNTNIIKLLLVEDSVINTKLILEMLKNFGWNIDIAENGRVAVEMCFKNEYDIVLMDIQMPVMDGYIATKKIKDYYRMKSIFIPIIALTAHAMEADRQKCLAAGCDDYLTKPVDYKTLKNVLDKWLDAKYSVKLVNGESYISLSELADVLQIDQETCKSLCLLLKYEIDKYLPLIVKGLVIKDYNLCQVYINNILKQFSTLNIPLVMPFLKTISQDINSKEFDKIHRNINLLKKDLVIFNKLLSL